MDLAQFMDLVQAKLEDVASATGYDTSTISRLRGRALKRPSYQLIRDITRWADDLARREGLRSEDRLDWDWLDSKPRSKGRVA